jgi:hypothetical protein
VDDDPRWSEVSAEYLQASAEALTELAAAVSSPDDDLRAGSPLYVDVVHFDHRYFLSPVLRGFSLLRSAGGEVAIAAIPVPTEQSLDFAQELLADWARPDEVEQLFAGRAGALMSPVLATRELPFTWAVAAGRPVAEQMREVLEALTSLVARQGLSRTLMAENPDDLPARIHTVEAELEEETSGVADSTTRSGWRTAAAELQLRARRTGRPLRVRYRPTVFDATELAERAPLLRETYNRLQPVRDAVDRIASGISRSMRVAGDGPADVLRTVNDQMENQGVRQFLAHTLRDAHVCGNGTLVLADMMSGAHRLIQPETLISVDGEVAVVKTGDGPTAVSPVLHMTGVRQLGSSLGISLLEPFIMTCVQRDTFLSSMLTAELILASPVAGEQRLWAERMRPYCREQLHALDRRMRDMLGTVTEQFVDAAPGTYFEGRELMRPAAGRVTIVDRLDEVAPYGTV